MSLISSKKKRGLLGSSGGILKKGGGRLFSSKDIKKILSSSGSDLMTGKVKFPQLDIIDSGTEAGLLNSSGLNKYMESMINQAEAVEIDEKHSNENLRNPSLEEATIIKSKSEIPDWVRSNTPTPAASKPSTPAASKPSAPAASKPSTPAASKPSAPAASKPSTPAASKPSTPAASRRASPRGSNPPPASPRENTDEKDTSYNLKPDEIINIQNQLKNTGKEYSLLITDGEKKIDFEYKNAGGFKSGMKQRLDNLVKTDKIKQEDAELMLNFITDFTKTTDPAISIPDKDNTLNKILAGSSFEGTKPISLHIIKRV